MRTTETPNQQTFTLHGVQHIEPIFAADALANENALLLDIREDEELEVVRFDESVEILHIPLLKLVERIEELPKDRPLIVVCNDGVRSTKAVNLLNYQGYPNSLNLDGGIVQWFRDSLPLILRDDIAADDDCGTSSSGCSGCSGC